MPLAFTKVVDERSDPLTKCVIMLMLKIFNDILKNQSPSMEATAVNATLDHPE
jgi:hypothetical protein